MRRLIALAVAMLLAVPASIAGAKPAASSPASQKATLRGYAADTWRSFVMMTDEHTGLPADNVSADGRRSEYTSPTNIGAYMWSTLAARDIGVITPREARSRIARTLRTVSTLERHEPSGQFFNWYRPTTGEKLTTWPVDGNPVYPFLSSVDNGWLAASLKMVAASVPQLREQASALYDSMDFGFYYDPGVGQIRGGYWTELPPNQVYAPQVSGGCQASPAGGDTGEGWTCHHYGALNTEPRIASYIGISKGEIPPEHYFKMFRTFPNSCDWSWQETKPEGVTRTYLGVDVFEGHYSYRGMDLVPSWGGSMFEALMVPLLVPEEQWGTRSWGINHPLYVQSQIAHGMDEAGYGYWGFSPSNNPAGGYREYGVDQIGLNPDGYSSDQQRTTVDNGFEGCRPASNPEPVEYGDGVVTPHASFLALDFAPVEALANLQRLRNDFDVYGDGGFYDAVDVGTAEVSEYYLALDQG
ncbi:MAG: DUF3131 domain-containing protein, partial [Euzebyales bacterium]|nr:DUF3131 domain-containing protein [Euzebyales bacterium]